MLSSLGENMAARSAYLAAHRLPRIGREGTRMRFQDGVLRYSASDLANLLACRHLTRLDLAATHGLAKPPSTWDLGSEALARRGEEHESRVVAEFRERGWTIEDVSDVGGEWEAKAESTARALKSGADVVYQGVLVQENRIGLPDFLVRADLLNGSDGYEVVDAKLARSAKARAVLQSAFYSRLLSEVSGSEPERMHLALGHGELVSFRTHDYAAYERQVDRLFAEFIGDEATYPPSDTYPDPVEHCAICRWQSECVARRRSDDDLSLIAGITARQGKSLKVAGVSSRRDFARMDEPPLLPRVGKESLGRVHAQARLQVRGEDQGELLWELIGPERTEDGELTANRGLLALPEPSGGDLFFDIEGTPYYSEDGKEFGLQYLFGIVDSSQLDDDGHPRYYSWWAFDRASERIAFEEVVDFMAERLSSDPQAHVYHYNHYEPTSLDHLAELHMTREDVLRRLMGRFATRELELDNLLRRQVFVDLFRVVRQGIRASVESYSLKTLEPLHDFTRQVNLADVNDAIAAFEMTLDQDEAASDREHQLLIAGYNEDDCRSTRSLREWLEERRDDLEVELGEDAPRPKPEELEEETFDPELVELRRGLLEDVPEAEQERTAEQSARALLADLLEFHRRDDKPKWWRYFHLRGLTDGDLLEEPDAISGLEFEQTEGKVKRSVEYSYRFPPQEHGFRDGDVGEDPVRGNLWRIHRVDEAAGTLTILRGPSKLDDPHPSALIEPRPQYQKRTHAQSLLALAHLASSLGESEWPHTGALDLLLRRKPNIERDIEAPLRSEDEDALTASRRLAVSLNNSCLPIQGPPGTGKTFTAAIQVVDLVRAGRRVGVTANSHAVITNLLDKVAVAAQRERAEIRIGQKAGDDDRWVSRAAADAELLFTSNAQVRDALEAGNVDVVGGTTWVWTHPDLEGRLDVLIVDEAAQMSLADALAASRSAKTLILLGDPMQLAQPSAGAHPPGADVSALGHVLGDLATMPNNLGLFIERTRRLHPEIRRFVSETFYDNRLLGIEGLELQEILGEGNFAGSGIRTVEVEHEGNANASTEEAVAVAHIVQDVIGRPWRDKDGEERVVEPKDVLVVTPFNAQIREIEDELGQSTKTGIRIGTVDKFQGQQAPVVVYSMASSSPDYAPRGMEFLYDLHRLNVAVSRAQCMAVVVCNPGLTRVFGRTPRQMRLANALCSLLEHAP